MTCSARVRPKGCRKMYWHFSFEPRGLRSCKAPKRGPRFPHCHDSWCESHQSTARAFGSEYALDTGAFTVNLLLQSAYSWTSAAPDAVSCVQQSPKDAGPAVAHPMPSTPAPFLPFQLRSWAIDLRNFCQFWGCCLLPLPSPLGASRCLCLASARGVLGWAVGGSPSCLLSKN